MPSKDPLEISSGVSEESLEIAAKLTDQLRDISTFTKEFTNAINSVVKPMREVSDFSKAVKEHNAEILKSIKEIVESTDKNAKNTAKLKEDELEIMKAITNTALSQKDLNASGSEAQNIIMGMLSAEKEIHDLRSAQAKQDIERGNRTRERNIALEKEISIITAIGNAAEGLHHKLSNLPVIGQVHAKTSGTLGQVGFGQRNMVDAVKSIGSSITSLLPAAGGLGGLVGLMIAGRVEDAKFDAIGKVSQQAFDTLGGATKEFASRMASTARSLSAQSMAAVEDLAHVNTAFAGTGISAKEAQEKIEGFSSAAGNDLIAASLSLDKALELPAGTMAKMSGTLSQMSNTSAKEALMSLNNIGAAAEKSGMSMATFMQQVMDASGSLRLLEGNYEAVGQVHLNFSRGMIDKGVNANYAQQYSAAATTSVTQSMAGLSDGLSAIIGQRLGYGKDNMLDAWHAMKSGDPQVRGEKFDVAKIAAEAVKIVKESGATETSQMVRALTSITGVSVGGAESMIKIQEALASGNKPLEEDIKKMNEGLRSESEKTSSIDRSLKLIKDGLLHTGVGLLEMTVAGIKAMLHALMSGFTRLGAKLTFDTDEKDLLNAKADMYDSFVPYDIKDMSRGNARFQRGLKETGAGAEGLISPTLGKRWFAGKREIRDKAREDKQNRELLAAIYDPDEIMRVSARHEAEDAADAAADAAEDAEVIEETTTTHRKRTIVNRKNNRKNAKPKSKG